MMQNTDTRNRRLGRSKNKTKVSRFSQSPVSGSYPALLALGMTETQICPDTPSSPLLQGVVLEFRGVNRQHLASRLALGKVLPQAICHRLLYHTLLLKDAVATLSSL